MGKILNKKQIPMLLFTLFCLAIAVPLRTFLIVSNTEKDNGFYLEDNGWVWLLYGVMALAILTPLFYNMRLSQRIAPFGKSRSRAISFTGIAFAAAMICDFVNQTVSLFNTLSSLGGVAPTTFYQNGGLPLVFQAAFAIVGAFYILIYAFSFFGGTLNYRNFKMIGVFPALWLACRVIRHFLVEINYLRVSQLLMEMLMLILAIIFFFNLAKLNACFPDGVKNWKLFGSGWGCFFLCVLLTVPRVIAHLFYKDVAFLPSVDTVEAVDFIMGAFVLMYLMKGSVVRLEKIPRKKTMKK